MTMVDWVFGGALWRALGRAFTRSRTIVRDGDAYAEDARALASDWEAVGMDLWSSIDQYEAERREDGGEMMHWWWLSFCDGDRPKGSQFLGAVLVQASDIADAASKAWLLGINPGGEVRGMPAPPTFMPLQGWTNRLLSRADCEEFDRVHANH